MKNKLLYLIVASSIVFITACSNKREIQKDHISISNIPDLKLDQKYMVTVKNTNEIRESTSISLQHEYGLIVDPDKIVLTKESPIAEVTIYARLPLVNTRIKALINDGEVYSNDFSILTARLPDFGKVSDIEINRDKNEIYVSSSQGNIYKSKFNSADKSSSRWQSINRGKIFDNSAITSMSINEINDDLYVTTNKGHAYLFIESSQVWKELGNGQLPNNEVGIATRVDKKGNLILATNRQNLYVASENSKWLKIGNGSIPDGSIVNSEFLIKIVEKDNATEEDIYIGTTKAHVFRSTLTLDGLASSKWMLLGDKETPDSRAITSINVNRYPGKSYGNVYVGTINGNIYFLSNSHHGWKLLTGSAPASGSVDEIYIGENGDVYSLLVKGNGTYSAYYTEATGFDEWKYLDQIRSASIPDGCNVTKIISSFPHGTNQFMGTTCGNVYMSNNAFNEWTSIGL